MTKNSYVKSRELFFFPKCCYSLSSLCIATLLLPFVLDVFRQALEVYVTVNIKLLTLIEMLLKHYATHAKQLCFGLAY